MWGSGKCPLMKAPAKTTNTIMNKMIDARASEGSG